MNKIHNVAPIWPQISDSLKHYRGSITEIFDEHRKDNLKDLGFMKTYLMKPSMNGKMLVCAIRVPGATRGYIELKKCTLDETRNAYQIEDIVLYEDTAFSEKLGCYNPSLKNVIDDLIGDFILYNSK